MAKFKNILDIINTRKESNCNINIELTKEDILKVCNIHPRDKISNYSMGYISNWINAYLKYHIPEIKVLLYGDSVYITNSMEVAYDNIHTKYPSGNMHKHKFDFEIKRKCENDFRSYKNCGISNTIIPKCGAYIITTEEGQYIGSSINICNRLRQHVSLSNNEDFQQFRDTIKIRSLIKSITIYECDDEDDAKCLEKKLIDELHPKLNEQKWILK